MSSKSYSAFVDYEFFGEFFPSEEHYSARFSGKICYSPETGLQLKYNIVDTDVPDQCEYLLGILENGESCTLIGPFDFKLSGRKFGGVSTKFGTYGFPFLAIGGFFEENNLFNNCRFTFHHMQEFFYPQGHVDSVAYKNNVLETIEGKNWTIDLENRATGTDVTNNLSNVIMTDSEEALIELSELFEKIKKKYPNEYFLLRKSFGYIFNYKPRSPQKISDINLELNKLSSIFSMFMHNPTFPDEMRIYYGEKKESAWLLASMFLESRTVKLINKKQSHFLMPINKTHIDLSAVLEKWDNEYDNYRVLATTFQYETNFRTLHSSYSDVVLYATNLESIAHDLGMTTTQKYEGPILRYGCDTLVSQLRKIFSEINSDSLGINISSLRNELTHVGRPKRLINRLNINDYIDVGYILRLVVVSHLFVQLGVHLDITHKYQEKLLN